MKASRNIDSDEIQEQRGPALAAAASASSKGLAQRSLDAALAQVHVDETRPVEQVFDLRLDGRARDSGIKTGVLIEELDDPQRLRARLTRDGDLAIARELHVARGTVRRARERLGIPAMSPGKRRTGSAPHPAGVEDDQTIVLLLDRFRAESRPSGPPPTEDLLLTRLRAAHEARVVGDDLALDDALLGIASAAGLVHRHRRRARGG